MWVSFWKEVPASPFHFLGYCAKQFRAWVVQILFLAWEECFSATWKGTWQSRKLCVKSQPVLAVNGTQVSQKASATLFPLCKVSVVNLVCKWAGSSWDCSCIPPCPGFSLQICGCPLYWKAPLFNASGGERTGRVSVHSFVSMWRKWV